MSSKLRQKDLERRYTAHMNLMKIAVYHGVPDEQVAPLRFPTVAQYAQAWGETIVQGGTHAVLQRDSDSINFRKANGEMLIIIFIPSQENSKNINRSDIKDKIKIFLQKNNMGGYLKNLEGMENFDEVSLIQGADYKGSVGINLNLQLIIYSKAKLDSGTMMDIINYNNMVKHPMKHFTVEELQFDPTVHITGPKYVKVLTSEEVKDLIDRQIGLRGEYGIDDLGADKLQELEKESDNPYKQQLIEQELRNLALSKLPTINSTDPWVKWRGYRIGDILYIERRAGLTPVCYRQVIRLDLEIYKEAKTKSTIKIKSVSTNN